MSLVPVTPPLSAEAEEAALQIIQGLIPVMSQVVALAPGLEDVFATAGRDLSVVAEPGGTRGEDLVAAVTQATANGARHLVVPGALLRWLETQDALLDYLAENAFEVTWREEALALFRLEPQDQDVQELQRLRVVREISPNDLMYTGARDGYFNFGRSGLQCVRRALQLTGRDNVSALLDLPSGHGRVLRFLKAAWPEAEVVACDLDRDGVDFCAATLGARPVYSEVLPRDIPLTQQFDAIWVGSLVTHLDAPQWDDFLAFWAERLLPGGALVFTFHGEHIIEACRMERTSFGIDDLPKLVSKCDESGFAYQDYAGHDRYGISLSRSDWVRARISETRGLELLDIWPRGWFNWHDVAVATADHVDARHLTSGFRPGRAEPATNLPEPPGLLIIGQSHAAALWAGALRGGSEDAKPHGTAPLRCRRYPFDPIAGPLWEVTLSLATPQADRVTAGPPQLQDEEGEWRKDWDGHVRMFAARAAEAGAAAVIWKGFQLDVLALVLVGPSFDVVLDGAHQVPGTTLVPRSAVEEALYELLEMELYRDLLQAFVDVLPGGRVAVLAPPPPIAGSFAREHLAGGDWLRTKVERLGLDDPSTVPFVDDSVRHKLWRILLQVHESVAAEFGATFVPPPAESLSADGTLRTEFVREDAQHANAEYGALYLAKIVEALRSSE